MKVIYIRDSKSKGYIRIGFACGELKAEYTLKESEYQELGSLLVGDEAEDIAPFIECDMRYRARLYALRILEYGDNNEASLLRKLMLRNVSADIAKKTAREMIGLGYVNERRQLERIIESEVNKKLIGRKKLVPKLISKGYKRKEIDEVISDLISHGVVDFEKSKEELIKKHLPESSNTDEKKRLLYKFGY